MTEKIRVLFTIPNFITAGSGGAMLSIIQRLDPDLFEPAVCVSKKGGRLDTAVLKLGIPFIESPFTLPARPYHTLLSRARAAAAVFRPFHFHLWHSFHYADDYTEPIIARLSGARAWVYTKKNMNWGGRAWLLRSLFASRVAAQNQAMLTQFFSSPLFRAKVRLIPRGVDLQKFYPSKTPSHQLREQLGIPPNALLLGCVAHLLPVKGQLTLIEALSHLPDARLVLAGRADDRLYREQLQAKIDQLSLQQRIHFLGDVADVPTLLNQLDVVVLPTWDKWRREGCPVALLEAMACAKACVATAIPGSRDIIENGLSGLLVQPEDPLALAQALKRLAEDPSLRARLGAAARERVQAHFSIEKEVASHAALYQELMG